MTIIYGSSAQPQGDSMCDRCIVLSAVLCQQPTYFWIMCFSCKRASDSYSFQSTLTFGGLCPECTQEAAAGNRILFLQRSCG